MSRSFGGLRALDAVDLVAEPGEVTALIGPNGAGKTTLFGCLTGEVVADAGTVELGGRSLDGLRPEDRARAGLARTFQRLEVFGGLTVTENLQVALDARRRRPLWRELLGRAPEEAADRALVAAVLDLLGLGDVADEPAGVLPTGLARLVELGRALCTDPGALLLDEPASGLDSAETARLQDVLTELAGRGATVVLVEHDVELVLAVSAAVVVLDFGRVIATGTPQEITANSVVRSAYLGAGT